MRDLHEGIVCGHTEVVHRQAVAAHDDKIAQGVCAEGDAAPHAVIYDYVLMLGNPESVAIGCALGLLSLHFLPWKMTLSLLA